MLPTLSRSDFKNMSRVLIKAGTSVVTHKSGVVAVSRIACIVEQIRHLLNDGKKVILVSSGAVGIGKQKLGHHLSPEFEKNDIYMRSFAATGQSGLMGIYEYMFSYYKIKCAQILLTDDDISITERRENVTNTINNLLKYNVVPILNENDVISTRKTPYRDDNIKILWDNDSLACLVSIECKINMVILLTDVDGLYKNMNLTGDKLEVIDIYNKVVASENNIIIGPKSRVGRGGMKAKIDNALAAVEKGVKVVVIANGKKMDTIDKIICGENIGTCIINKKYLTKIQLNPSQIAVFVREESLKLQQLSTDRRKRILLSIANELKQNIGNILFENEKDLNYASEIELNAQLLQRLKLTHKKLTTVIAGIIQIAHYREPIGEIIGEIELSKTLNLKQITCPIGVLLVIFESRPDVLPQVISLSIKSGNGLLLKGGKEAYYSNKILYKIISAAITKSSNGKINGNKIIYLIENRKDIKSLLQLDKHKIDLIIPRGSMKFVKFIENNTSIPVLGHSSGLCHLYIDKYANLQKTLKILIDSKCNYPSACNSVETLLINIQFAKQYNYMEQIISILQNNNVNIFIGPKIKQIFPKLLSTFNKCESFNIEYGDLDITIEIVSDIIEAINHINKYSSHHTDSIITENKKNKKLFLNMIDSSCVFVNASTRFADGYRFGLGAEVGISTNRIHARGPVGIKGLLTTKWILNSNDYDCVNQYQNGKKKYIHQKVELKAKL